MVPIAFFYMHMVDLGPIKWLSITAQFKVVSSSTCSTQSQLVSEFFINLSGF